MAYDIGPRIGIDGEAEFRKQLQTVNTSIKTLGTEMTAVTSSFIGQEKSVESLTAQNDVLQRTIYSLNDKLDMQKKALQESVAAYGEADARTMKWQQAVNSTTAELNKSQAQLDQNEQAIKDLGDESTSTGKKLEDAGEKGSGFGSKIGAGMKAASVAIAAVSAAATAAVAALGKMVTNAAYAADDINTLSKQTGLSTEQIQKFQFASEQVDVSLDTLTGSMAKLTKNMATAQKGTGDANRAFKALGVSITDESGNLRDNQDVFDETIAALGKMENETQADAYAMQIFGRSAQDLNPLIKGGADTLKELGDQAEAAGVILSQDSLDSLNTVSDAMDTFKATATGAGRLFSTAFAEPIAQGVNTITGYMQQLTKAFEADGIDGLSDEIGNILSDIISKINEFLPRLIELGTNMILSMVQGMIAMLPDILNAVMQIFTTVWNTISEALPTLIPLAVQAIMTIVQGLMNNIPMIIQTALNLITALVQGIIQAIPVLVEALPKIITALVQGLLGAIPQLIQAGIDLLTALVGALPEIIQAIVEAIPLIIDGIITALIDSIPLIIQAGIDLFLALIDALPQIIVEIVKAIPQIIDGIVNGLIGNIDKIILAGVQLFVALIENLPTIIIEIVKAVPEIIKGIVEAFGSLMYKIVEIGGNLVKGIWEGIKNAAKWLWEKVTGFFSGIVDGVKNFLGIHSPSTVFADMGKNMALGLGNGFESEMKGVNEQIEAAIPTPSISMADVMAGTVNGIQTAMNGMGGSYRVEIPLFIDGKEFYRATISDLRSVMRANPVTA